MQTWIGRIVILALLAIIVAVPVAWRPPREQIDPDALGLVIITPHNEQIRYETAHAFSRWHKANFGKAVRIDWRTPGGTSDIRRILISQYTEALKKSVATGEPIEDVGFDLVFGGGDYEFDKYLRRVGVSFDAEDEQGNKTTHHAPITQAIQFDKADVDLQQIYGQTGQIAGANLYDRSEVPNTPGTVNPPAHWYGVVLSSFGIVYNRDALQLLGLPEPTDWLQLADGKYFAWVALGDPRHSGSVRVTYNTIIQRYGWWHDVDAEHADVKNGYLTEGKRISPLDGWQTLRRVFANARYFSNSSSQVPVDVSAGDAAAGMCIDFYGRLQAEAVGNDRVGYVSPVGTTVYSSDPIAVLNGVRDTESDQRLTLAKRFVEFQLTREGQAVWCFPPTDYLAHKPEDNMGPLKYALRRPPVRQDMYEPALRKRMIDQVNYFDDAVPISPDTPNYMGVIDLMLSAMAMDVHDEVKAAWRAILDENDPAKRAKMEAIFDAMPFDAPADLFAAAKRWDDEHVKEDDRLAWTKFFRANYLRVVEMAGDR